MAQAVTAPGWLQRIAGAARAAGVHMEEAQRRLPHVPARPFMAPTPPRLPAPPSFARRACAAVWRALRCAWRDPPLPVARLFRGSVGARQRLPALPVVDDHRVRKVFELGGTIHVRLRARPARLPIPGPGIVRLG